MRLTPRPDVLAWLDDHHDSGQPFFLYVHLLEPHSPYNPPPEDDLFKSDAYPYLTNDGYDLVRGGLFRLAVNGDEKAVERLYQLYDGKIHYVDRYAGKFSIACSPWAWKTTPTCC